jgi:hypothetical protein
VRILVRIEGDTMTLIITAPKAELGRFASLYRLRGYKLTAAKKTRNGFWRIVAWR